MPLSKSESKAVLVNLFRLSLALSEKRNEDAVSAYSRIVEYTLYDPDDEMPPLVQAKQDDIDLIISEIKQEPTALPTLFPSSISVTSNLPTVSSPLPYNNMSSAFPFVDRELSHIEHDGSDDEAEVESEAEAEEEEAEAEEEADAEAETEAEEEEEEAEAEEEEKEAEAEEEEEEVEEEELPLESVRIKKVFYWKNTDNGDIYKCLPDGELGEKVGKYVDDKPVFD